MEKCTFRFGKQTITIKPIKPIRSLTVDDLLNKKMWDEGGPIFCSKEVFDKLKPFG